MSDLNKNSRNDVLWTYPHEAQIGLDSTKTALINAVTSAAPLHLLFILFIQNC